MNKHILMAMDSVANPGKYKHEQLRKNCKVADAAAYAADDADAANVTYEYWLNKYFERSSESKQDYIDEINKGYKYE